MKRENNLYAKIIDMNNLRLAQKKARKGKGYQYGVRLFDRNPEKNLQQIHDQLKNKTYKTSPYKTFSIFEPKERLISSLPYIDRIVQHGAMNFLEKIFVNMFTADCYSCVKGRGIGGFYRNFRKALTDINATTYCLEIDITKFYPSIDHRIIKQQLRRKFKDQELLWLLDGIIDSAPGVPIGNYLSQYFANFYLTGFDHWIKEVLKVKYYFRYCDDIRILCETKEELHRVCIAIQEYLQEKLKLTIKPNYRVLPVLLGIDVIGYKFYRYYTLLRKSIKKNFARAMRRKCRSPMVISGYWGWAKWADTKHLFKKLTAWQQIQQAA